MHTAIYTLHMRLPCGQNWQVQYLTQLITTIWHLSSLCRPQEGWRPLSAVAQPPSTLRWPTFPAATSHRAKLYHWLSLRWMGANSRPPQGPPPVTVCHQLPWATQSRACPAWDSLPCPTACHLPWTIALLTCRVSVRNSVPDLAAKHFLFSPLLQWVFVCGSFCLFRFFLFTA